MINPEVIYCPREAILSSVNQFETPFFLYEERLLRKNCRQFQQAFGDLFPDFWPLFAVKANMNPYLLKIIRDEGFGVDCASEAEAWISHKLGMQGMYTGNYTTPAEFAFVRDKGMILNLDDISMLPTLAKQGMPATLSFRINPGIGDGSEEGFVTAGPKAKYGVPFEQASEAYRQAQKLGVKHFGIHMMTGTNIPLDKKEYFGEIVERLLEIVADVKS